jgi:hypothetical protein
MYQALNFEAPSSQRISGGMEPTIGDTQFDYVVTVSLYCN